MSRVPERRRIETWVSRATLKYFPFRLHEKLIEQKRWKKTGKTVRRFGDNYMSGNTWLERGPRRLLHGMRVSFGFTFYDHGVFGVNNMVLHRLLYDGRRLPDCRQRHAVTQLSLIEACHKWHACSITDSLSRGTSKAQTLCHKRSSRAGSTRVPIFTAHGTRQLLPSPVLLLLNVS